MTRIGLFFLLALLLWPTPAAVRAAGTTYYVSSSAGDDDNDGLSEGIPFRTVARVNALALQPGDQVLSRCGDTWRAEQLVLGESGTAAEPILLSSYPAGCANKPVSGTEMTAAISAADVSAVAVIPVTVYDAGSTPPETSPLTFYVVDSLVRAYLPLVRK